MPDNEVYNEGCPSRCVGERHEPPEIIHNVARRWIRVFRCPNDNTAWCWCDGCLDWVDSLRIGALPTIINGQSYCDPYEHEYAICDRCGEWCHYDSLHSDDYGEETYCESCFRANEEEAGDNPEYSASPGRCGRCRQNAPVKIHPLTEDCTCHVCEDPNSVSIEEADTV